ncbi:MAG: tRNA (guanosine(46)-N7)-methyltransferase TrmB [Ruminococcaceae bacterium]|nr:tRNA (guanosine(46)-N7)-methyltransferase TrmB [Oscillospiraceae bacterium]
MRMRKKQWAQPELNDCPFFCKDAAAHQGDWRKEFCRPEAPLCLELGCGKGGFLSQMGLAHPEQNFIGIDLISNMLGVARRRIVADYEAAGREVENLLIFSWDISRIKEIFPGEKNISAIYINFCNPWPKAGHHKRRLTHPRQLEQYKALLSPDGKIVFKTDDSPLFEASVEYFREAGFRIEYLTRNLGESDFPDSPATEHQLMFEAEGIPTKLLVARPE